MTTNPSPAPPSLAEVYEQYFTMVRADTPALREAAFRLRYQVYCVENAFEDPSHFPDRMEYDAYDQRAVHALLVHRPTGNVAGTASVTGLLRISEPGGGFLRSNDAAADRWYSRDVVAIASARGLGEVAPYFVDADAAAEPGPLPQGGMTQVSFRNTHLVYALTWFCLALMSAGAAIFLIRRGGEEAP